MAFCRLDQSEKERQIIEKRKNGEINEGTFYESLVVVQFDHTPEYLKGLETDIKVKQKLATLLEKKLSKVKNDSWAGYHLPNNEAKKKSKIDYLLSLQFKAAEVERVVEPHEFDQKEKADIQNEITVQDPEYFPPDVIDLMNKARAEIELIYKAIKEGEGFKNVGEKFVEARMKDALNYFKEHKDKFEIIGEEDLQNEEMFETSTSQYARTVKGKLLQTIVKRHGLGRHPYDKLFKEYQKKYN